MLWGLSDSLFLLVLLWFGWYRPASPRSVTVLIQMSFFCAAVRSAGICLGFWTGGAQRVLWGEVCVLCHDLGPRLPWSNSAEEFLQLLQGRWEWAALVGILCQRCWSALVQMHGRFHLKSQDNKCRQTAAL